MRRWVLRIIRLYQRVQPFKYITLFHCGCRFQPACSEYTYEAIIRYGTIKGLFLGFGRIIRCHPFSKRGYDPLS